MSNFLNCALLYASPKPITTHHHHIPHSHIPCTLATPTQHPPVLPLRHAQDSWQSLTLSYALTLCSFPWLTTANIYKKYIIPIFVLTGYPILQRQPPSLNIFANLCVGFIFSTQLKHT